jgi:prolyl oligopeptidase
MESDGQISCGTPSETTDEDAKHRLRITSFALSPHGRYVAVGTSDSGKEFITFRILDGKTGRDLGDRSEDVRLGALAWFMDDSGYLYMRGRGDTVAPLERSKDFSVAYHKLGTPSDADTEVAGAHAAGGPPIHDYDYAYPQTSLDGDHAIVDIHHGTSRDSRVFVTRFIGRPNNATAWRQVYGESDHVRAIWPGHRRLLTIRATDSGSLVEEVSLSDPDKRRPLYSSAEPLDALFELGRSIYVVEVRTSGRRLLRLTGTHAATVFAGDVSVSTSLGIDWIGHTAAIRTLSWTNPGGWMLLDDIGRSTSLEESGSPPALDDKYEVRELVAPARDGESIPLTIIGPRGDNSPRYVWFRAYGAYGVSIGPTFDPARRVFLDIGGTYVVAHVRGGGERGILWHESGRGAKKITTVEDAIDAVRFLRSTGFGAGGGIFAFGGSAGGIPIGGLLVREPELVDAVCIVSGVLNVSRLEATSPVGPGQREEFGTADTPEGARRLREIDAFENVRHGVRYPPVLLITAMDDYRVPYWQSTKFAARLEGQGSDFPVLLEIMSGGHMAGRTHSEESTLDAEILSFALSSLHHPFYQ